MYRLYGRYSNAIIYANEYDIIPQILDIINSPISKNCKIRIMPDTHVGNECVIGFTSTYNDKICPNFIGVDIGCGVISAKIKRTEINFQDLDDFIKNNIPNGKTIHSSPVNISDTELLENIKDVCNRIKSKEYSDYVLSSIGTLGGGNHFIEIEQDPLYMYITIHTGSRNFGYSIATYYNKIAKKKSLKHEYLEHIKEIKSKYNGKDIESKIKELRNSIEKNNKIKYLEGDDCQSYLHDINVAQKFAKYNRKIILDSILNFLNIDPISIIESIHNYIDLDNRIIRKGAIASYKGQLLVIPLNMKDGIIIGIGKGNKEWNYSAPHGAGRKLSRSESKSKIDLNKYKNIMSGIWSSCINDRTIDESPFAYKDTDMIIDSISDTVTILNIAKPLYVFKGT